MTRPAAIKLSICIATFNRAAFIGETLDSIGAQLTDTVEIVILDGGSTDDTERVVGEYKHRFDCLRYIRQSTNHGVDQDFDSVVEQAHGEYCWLMSDDDLLLPDALATVLEAIHQGYSLVVVNAEVRNADMSRVLQRRRLAFDADRVYPPQDMDRLFIDAGDYLTFIACVVIKRSIWLERERQRYFGSLFIHVGVIFQQLLPGAARVIARPLISIRYGNAMWRPREFEIWMFKWPSLIWSLPGLSDDARSRVCAAEPWRSPGTLLLYRAKGTYSAESYRRWIQPRIAWRAGLTARLVALFPGFLANALLIAYYRLRGGERGMGLLDMRNSRFHVRNWRLKPGGS